MDTSLFFLLNRDIKNPIFDVIMPVITSKPYLLFMPFALYLLASKKYEFRKRLILLSLCLISVGLSDGTASILKTLFERQRPCHILKGVNLLVGCTGSFSFPSNHAANAFSLGAGLAYFFRGAAIPLYLLSAIVALSRIYVGVHYPSDVIFGAILGTLSLFSVLGMYGWIKKNMEMDKPKTILISSILILTILRFFYINSGPLDLSPDEAHYWEWSRRLDLSYYSKGPMIAYLIAFSTWLFGDSVFAVRFLAPLLLAASSIFVYKLTREAFNDERPAVVSAMLIHIVPLFSAFGAVMTIDSPFIFFWTLALWLFWRAIRQGSGIVGWGLVENLKSDPQPPIPNPSSSLVARYWYLTGLTIGFGLLTKYTMAFFYVCAFLFLIFSKEHRFWFKRKELYIAFALSLMVFSPVIIWNMQHDWVTLKHTAGQAHVAEGVKLSAKNFFEFLGSQIGVLTPVLFFMVIYGAVKSLGLGIGDWGLGIKVNSKLKTQNSKFLFWFWAPVLVFFLLKSIQGKVQANWAMPAYFTAVIASMGYFLNRDFIKNSAKKWLIAASAMAFLITILSYYPAILNLPPKKDPTSRLRGWEELGKEVGAIISDKMTPGENVFIFSDSYQVSSELAFYVKGGPRTYCVNLGRRMNQYDIWGGWEDLIGRNAILVRIGDNDFPEELKSAFASFEKQRFIVKSNGRILREYSIFKCYNFKGLPLRGIESY
ncbi:MAG: glycosyltransferase family 39 protein [Nitrospirae bacterium]|nr:glycosyltransferase family 39 protein [Nitrospirota bacterium]